MFVVMWSMIFNVNCFGVPKPYPYKSTNVMGKCVCPDCSTDQLFPHLSNSPWVSLFPGTQQY